MELKYLETSQNIDLEDEENWTPQLDWSVRQVHA